MNADKVKLIEQLLDLATQNREFANSGVRLLYERGYLTGLLSALIQDDYYAESYIRRRIRQLEESLRK